MEQKLVKAMFKDNKQIIKKIKKFHKQNPDVEKDIYENSGQYYFKMKQQLQDKVREFIKIVTDFQMNK